MLFTITYIQTQKKMRKEKEIAEEEYVGIRPPEQFIQLDWALMYLLKNKADYMFLEGFLSELLKKEVTIEKILRSKSNKAHKKDKYNRVDLLVKIGEDEHIVVELQASSESDSFSSILYGGSSVLVENISDEEDFYVRVTKVIGVNIIHHNGLLLNQNEDYICHGKMNFRGYHDKKPSKLNGIEKRNVYEGRGYESPDDICPEYYIINLTKFKKEVKDRLDEWIYFFKTSTIKPSFQAKGLEQAKKKLSMNCLSYDDKWAYDVFLKNEGHKKSAMATAIHTGMDEGREEVRAKRKAAEAKQQLILNVQQKSLPIETIADIARSGVEETERIISGN